jgi:hypothetical protein
MINAVLWQHMSFCRVRSVFRALDGTQNARYMLPQHCINHDHVSLLMTSTKKCNFSQIQLKAP